MHGTDLKRIRKNLGLDRAQFARLIGYTGTDRNNETRLRSYENGKLQVPLYIARFADLIIRWRLMFGKLPDFPDWSGYEFESKPDQQKDPIDG